MEEKLSYLKFENPYSKLYTKPIDKFVCKGKHQYKKKLTSNNVVIWVCQCGRILE